MKKKTKKILVTVDGSDNSDRALLEAKKYSQAFDAELTILTVLDHSFVLHYMNTSPSKTDDSKTREQVGEVILKEAVKLVDDFEGEVLTTLRNGNPADEILEEAEFGEFDLIIMGNRGLGVFSRTFLGSVSNKVLNHAKTNVLIVK